MNFPDLLEIYPDLGEGLRGKLTSNQPLSAVTWFRTGGPAQLMFQPADEEDLARLICREGEARARIGKPGREHPRRGQFKLRGRLGHGSLFLSLTGQD